MAKRAEQVRFVPDENGWELHVEDEDGQWVVFNVHGVAWELAAHAQETLGAWKSEGEAAWASFREQLRTTGVQPYPAGHPVDRGSFYECARCHAVIGTEQVRGLGCVHCEPDYDLARDQARSK